MVDEADILTELNAGVEDDTSNPHVTFASQLDIWFQLDYSREGTRVQYQRMVAMGKKSDTDPNIKPVIAQFVSVKEEMAVIEDLMVDVLRTLDVETQVKMLDAAHYIPQKGITLQVPAELRTRLLPV